MRMQSTETNLQVAQERIEELSSRLEEQEAQKQTHYHDKNLAKILKKYPTPPNRWNEYSILKKDLDPYLHDWLIALENLKLTNREKVFCIFIFIYRHLSISEVADYMNITDRAVRVLKTRVAQKLGITSIELIDYLQKMTNAD
jgi:DNA-directed RNA polymerase sigma subunit (sigma70/sigma32)